MNGFPPTFLHLEARARDAEAEALIYTGHQFSYGDLAREVIRLSGSLEAHGVRAGDVVGLVTTSPILAAWMVYTCWQSGVVLFPLDPAMISERYNQLLSQAGCRAVISELELDVLPQGVDLISVESLYELSDSMEPEGALYEQAKDGIQLIIATSGTEGDPKGVMLSGGNLQASSEAVGARLGLDSGGLWLCCLPLYHIGGLSILYRCVSAGAGVLLHTGFDAEQVWSDLHTHKVTHISLVPVMLSRLLDIARDAPPPEELDLVLVGGGPLEPGLAARAHARGWPLCVSYGMSESGSMCVVDCGLTAGADSGVAGLPLDGFEIAISQQGRIMLRGAAVMQGYANPELSPGVGLLEAGWFETGDLGEIDTDGRLRVLGRADDMLVSGGRNVHPLEVEGLLAACPGVNQIAVTGQDDERWGQVLVALYLGESLPAEVESWCRNHIPSPLRPRRFIQVTEFPHDAMGKLDRKSLHVMVNQR